MATISDKRLAEILRNDERCVQLHPNIPGRGPNPTRMDFEDRVTLARELQSLRSQAGVSEAVAYLHELCDENGKPFDREITSTDAHPFGRQGRDFTDKISVKTSPLYARPAPIEITEEMIERAMERAGWVTKPTPPEYESGNLIDNGISEEEADEINSQLTVEMSEILQFALQGETK